MQFTIANDIVMHYQTAGRQDGQRLVFINSLGTDFRIWNDVIAGLEKDYACLCYDKRGHGLTDLGLVLQDDSYSIDLLTDDLHALLQNIGWDSDITLIGLSVGGLIAQNYAYRFKDKVSRLVLMDTAAKIGTEQSWNERITTIKAHSIAAIGEQIMARWLTDDFKNNQQAAYQAYRNMLERTPKVAYCATCVALRDSDLREQTAKLSLPALVIAGAQDGSTPPELVKETARLIKGARFELIDACGHLPCIEQPQATIELLKSFLSEEVHG
ncbi:MULTISPECIES: 3-oxoadipate enol-lactonase [unclassified Bartonella]|uniref:3-oxoadipate enol-lactonase n=1 Tax=unclassified Bartonella TaxID=2645622 RepID=UPI0015FDA02C|nr:MULTISPECIES: 3-oxoadipate enol-lactonase [unclassified Bartonella]UXN03464.1 3-oxoadipate enol-lactonase [Bartonella sp. HY406]